jgi:hypothetical protein
MRMLPARCIKKALDQANFSRDVVYVDRCVASEVER